MKRRSSQPRTGAPGGPGGGSAPDELSPRTVLALNAGSSSLKWTLFGGDERLVARGAVEGIAQPPGRLWVKSAAGAGPVDETGDYPSHADALTATLHAFDRLGLPAPEAVGHRIVHGGPHLLEPARVDDALLATLRGLIPFAPLHLPPEIAAIEGVVARYPGLPQVACFDTAFHRRLPAVARRLALPRALADLGIQRYGFHGLSYEYLVSKLGGKAMGRAVLAHLGNGASLAAVRDGEPVDTTMGFTPAGGIVMGTRPGDLDPGVMVRLVREGWTAERLETLVNRESGLLGLSGSTADMRALLATRATDPRAAEAVESFCWSLRKAIGALAATLGGLDTLVFTAGIGERAAPVREETCRGLAHLGVVLDPVRNAAHAEVISAEGSRVTVRVVPTDEDVVIALHVRAVLGG